LAAATDINRSNKWVASPMPLPEFTPDEQFFINYIKSSRASSMWNSPMWAYVIGSALLCAYAVPYKQMSLMVVAFVILVGYRIFEHCQEMKWQPICRSIIEKYEAAADESDE